MLDICISNFLKTRYFNYWLAIKTLQNHSHFFPVPRGTTWQHSVLKHTDPNEGRSWVTAGM